MLRLRTQCFASALAVCLLAAPLVAAPGGGDRSASQRPRGRPDVKLDRLEFPQDVAGARYFEKRLRALLKKEARRADWGAGSGSKIRYRFAVTQLAVEQQADVLRVRCAAVGRLPGGKSAKSNLAFGGDPRQRNKIIERVLEIVARGVMTRLAELERVRRGDLRESGVRVRAPAPED